MIIRPICTGCDRSPSEIEEYVEAAAAEPDHYANADEYVREEEDTFNAMNGHFLCTVCYVRAGMPSSERGWVAP